MTKKILISAETRTWTTRARDPNDNWDNGDTAGEVVNVWACVEDQAEQHFYYGESAVVELDVNAGDTVYAVVADYESGCTFGRDGGHAQILNTFKTEAEANALAEAASEQTPDGGYSFEYEGESYHKSWVGYFESLQSIDVWKITVRDGYQSFLTPDNQRTYGHKQGQ